MKLPINEKELSRRIDLNFRRHCESYYDIDHVFVGDAANWPGDKEGRALLAFVSHYKINGKKVPCMEQMIDQIPQVTGGKMYFGNVEEGTIFEQQLSGHSWYLRGLCEYYEQFHDQRVLEYLDKTFAGMYRPTKGKYSTYPIDRTENSSGGVGGHSYNTIDGWKLSTDIGCAFMSIDGLSHYYKVTRSPEVKELVDEMIAVFVKIDKFALQAQTHCTLTAARGMVRMYEETGDPAYLQYAEDIMELYIEKGMTDTFQNFNWFGKGDTWTEPCAIVDSLMLAAMLYQKTGRESYRHLAARIYFNGLATAQRPNGGAGTDTCVSDTTPVLKVADVYEAFFCCTMRLAEGLWFVYENQDMLYAEVSGELRKENGRYMDGDILYAEITSGFEEYAGEAKVADGHTLFPILEYYKLKDEAMCRAVEQRILFP